MTLNTKELYTRAEVARIFGVQPETIKAWQKKGLRATPLSPKTLRYHRTDIQAFIDAAKQ